MKRKDAIEKALEREKDLSWNDLKDTAYVKHQDGSTFLFRYAVIEKHDNMIWVFSEHNQVMTFYTGDLEEFGYVANT